jgi:deazaflavin-dependent oxidoreductase (nitroreductase family)
MTTSQDDYNARMITEFRANAVRVGGHFEGCQLLILHTTGAKTGIQRVNPLMYVRDGDRYVIVASKAGADTDPDWFRNLRATPVVWFVDVARRAHRCVDVHSIPSPPSQSVKRSTHVSAG